MFSNKHNYLLFFCFVFALNLSAQDRNKAIVLKKVLQAIQRKDNVTFNYIESDIAAIKIIPPNPQATLEEKLIDIRKKTNLLLENLNDKYVNISKKIEVEKVCGYVFSKYNNLPQEGANVHLLNGKNTLTDTKGYFELPKGNASELEISHVGFETQIFPISSSEDKNCIKILLDVEVVQLDNVTTNHFLTSGISKTNEGTFIVKPKRLGILPGLIEPDVLQTMLQIPGIYSADESLSSINVRGGTHDQNLFLWNGIKMYQTGHFFGLISTFNPNLAQTISIAKNGSSAFYGESVSSVVDISSDSKKYEKPQFSAGINMINLDVGSKFNINKTGFIEIAARKSITDLIETPTYKKYYNKAFQNTAIRNLSTFNSLDYNSIEQFKFYDVTLKYVQEIGKKNRLLVDLITINDQIRTNQNATINTIFQSENNTLYQKNQGGNLAWKHDWNAKNSTKVNVFASSYELDAEKNKIQNNQIITQENRVFDDGIKVENHHIISPKFTLNNGYQYNEIGATNLDKVSNPMFYRQIKEVLRTHALIFETKYNDTLSKVFFNAGMRINYIEKFNKYLFEPRFQFNYAITASLNLEVLGEFKSQNCYQIIDHQQDYFGIEKRRWILSNNATIPIQRSKQGSICLSYKNNNWLVTFDNYYKQVVGINSSTQGFQNQLEFANITGDYAVLGTEILVQKKINHFITWLSYSYSDNTYHFPTLEQTTFSNNFELKNVLSWAGTYEFNHLKIALGSKWYSGRPETTPFTLDINNSNPSNPTIEYNLPNTKRIDDFFQVNFSTTYELQGSNKTQYKLGLSIINLFNKKNEISEYYRINAITNSIEEIKTYALERTPNISFRVVF